MLIIGFGHESGVGKDTLGSYVETELRVALKAKKIVRASLADPIKRLSQTLHATRDKIHYDNHREDRSEVLPGYGCTPVQSWVGLGQGINRIWPAIWAQMLLQENRDADVLIVCDIRRRTEIDVFRGNPVMVFDGAEYAKVAALPSPELSVEDTIRFDFEIKSRLYKVTKEGVLRVAGIDHHLELFHEWDGVVSNDGDKRELYKKAKELATELKDLVV